jgi:murein DD-endopeptidase MepM/ murein hydrolase activator NlpD
MQRWCIIFLAAALSLSSCDSYHGPVHVLNLGLHPDSRTGAMIVGAHDDLWNISTRYRLPIREIIDLNGLQPPYRLEQGQRLKLPAPVDYRVMPGDTLHSVASMFSVSESQLVTVNNIRAPYKLSLGQDLRIPEKYRQQEAYAQQQREETISPVVRVETQPEPRTVAAPLTRRPVREAAAPLAPPSSFRWPVQGRVISGYGPKDDGLYNDGINIAVPRGTPVAAAADGVVAYVGNDLKSYGNLILVRHGGGMMTAYAHLASLNARRGMTVRQGQVIGTVGSTGAVEAAQLHFEIRRGSKTCDPRQYLR